MIDQTPGQPSNGRYWLATDVQVAQVASDLGVPLVPGAIRELEGNFSRVFLLDGDDANQRVLKIRAQWMTEAPIRFEHALAGHLCGRGLPMAVNLAIGNDCTWAKVGDFHCEIAPYIVGREVRQALGEVRLMGELLGRFHRYSRDFDLSLYEPPHFQNQIEPREMEPQLKQLCIQAEEMEINDWQMIKGLIACWTELAAFYERQAISLPQVLRHGDFHPWNMLFSPSEPGQIVALFDLDMAALGPRIYDVTYAIYMLCRLHPEGNAEGWGTRYRRFIEGYLQSNAMSFTEDEVAVVPFLFESITLHFLIQNTARAGKDAASAEYAKYISAVDWLKSRAPGLPDIFRDLAGGR